MMSCCLRLGRVIGMRRRRSSRRTWPWWWGGVDSPLSERSKRMRRSLTRRMLHGKDRTARDVYHSEAAGDRDVIETGCWGEVGKERDLDLERRKGETQGCRASRAGRAVVDRGGGGLLPRRYWTEAWRRLLGRSRAPVEWPGTRASVEDESGRRLQ